jgi:hypothetical protein
MSHSGLLESFDSTHHRNTNKPCLGSGGGESSSVSIMSWLWTGWPGFNPCQWQRCFLLTSVSRQALVPGQPPIQWILRVKCGQGMMLTTQPHLALRSKWVGALPPFPRAPPQHVQGTVLLYTLRVISVHCCTQLSPPLRHPHFEEYNLGDVHYAHNSKWNYTHNKFSQIKNFNCVWWNINKVT